VQAVRRPVRGGTPGSIDRLRARCLTSGRTRGPVDLWTRGPQATLTAAGDPGRPRPGGSALRGRFTSSRWSTATKGPDFGRSGAHRGR
jgi:hypothetical protein